MRTQSLYFIFLLVMVLTSCEYERNIPGNKFTLHAQVHRGFVLDAMELIQHSNKEEITPDFTVLALMNKNGEILAPYLYQPESKSVFSLLHHYDNIDEAELSFSTYFIRSDVEFEPIAVVKPNQVWLIKNLQRELFKLLILRTHVTYVDTTPYAEITFKANKMSDLKDEL